MMGPRSVATRRVMKTIARRQTIQPLPVRLQDGSSPVIVTMPDDKLVDIVAQIETTGGRANVFVAFPEGLALVDCAIDSMGDVPETQQSTHHETTMAMYVAFLRHSNGEPVTVPVESGAFASSPSVRDIAYAF